MHRQDFHFREEPLNRFPALAILKPFIGGTIRLYVSAALPDISRKSQQGLWLFTAVIDGLEYAFACSDFRMNGGSLGIENSRRFMTFLAACRKNKLPLVFLINSMGVSFFEGRTVFNEAFSLIPALETYKKTASVFTIALKNVFGLAALLFGLGSYRIALHQQSLINLAGPQVFRLFFGRQENFNAFSEVNSGTRTGSLIHEICHGPEHALARVFEFNRFFSANTGKKPGSEIRLSSMYDSKAHSKALEKAHLTAANIINGIADEGMEIFPGFDTRLKVFLCKIDGHPAGVLINPIGFANTLLTSNTLILYTEALALFRHCRLPVISILDTPGADPSMVQGDYRIIETMLAASKAIIDYPHMKIGVIAGRAFGGATVLGFPKIFGGHANLAFRQADLGIMKADIIENLLSSSDKMLGLWQNAAKDMTKDLNDLIGCNIIDKVIEEHELKRHLAELLHNDTDRVKAK